MSPFWKLISSASDALKEKRATASMLNRGVNSFTSWMKRESAAEWLSTAGWWHSIAGWDECVCVWRQSSTSCSLVNEERCLCACVPPFIHVTELESVCTRGVGDCHLHLWCLHTLNSAALMKNFHKGNQWQRKEGRKEGVRITQNRVWRSGVFSHLIRIVSLC